VSTSAVVELVVRCALVMLFLPFSALDKILGFSHALGQAREVFKAKSIAALVLLCGLGIEVLMSLGVVTGIADRACALALCAYCAATALLFKRFWAQGDFWAEPDGKGRALFWDFLKNLSLGAGFLLIVIGADGSGLARFVAHPLSSSHPYSSAGASP